MHFSLQSTLLKLPLMGYQQHPCTLYPGGVHINLKLQKEEEENPPSPLPHDSTSSKAIAAMFSIDRGNVSYTARLLLKIGQTSQTDMQVKMSHLKNANSQYIWNR